MALKTATISSDLQFSCGASGFSMRRFGPLGSEVVWQMMLCHVMRGIRTMLCFSS